MLVDYAGHTIPVIDRRTGEIRAAQIFVAVLGASNYTYCEATWTQTLPDWIDSHVRMLEHFQAVPAILVPDNLRSGVTRSHRYEPLINATYADMAAHYRVAVLPARVYHPRDKAYASYCTSFGGLHGDKHRVPRTIAPAMAFDESFVAKWLE